MGMGFYKENEPAQGSTFDTAPSMEQTYVSRMNYKDI